MYAHLNTTHKLIVTLTGRKGGAFKYEIVEKSTGKVVSDRFSNRMYVAATTPTGGSYFGRVDLAQNAVISGKKIGANIIVAYLEEKPPFEIK